MTTRLHRRVLGPLWPEQPPADGGVFGSVTLSVFARRTLTQQLTAPATWRSGLLFGAVSNDVLHIHVTAPNGYRQWNDPVLDGNPEYQLGWADALQALGLPRTDWVGNWIMRPDNGLLDAAEIEHWLRRGKQRAIVDNSTIMLACGLLEGHLTTRPYCLIDNEINTLPVNK